MSALKKISGVALASAAAVLVLSGCESNGNRGAGYGDTSSNTAVAEAKIHCGGVNACKGTTACKTASNACKGQNSCKGKGWLPMSEKECDAKGGTVL